MRVLCLHGHTQSASSFSSKTGAIRKIFKNATFVYINAPFNFEQGKTWWTYNDSKLVGLETALKCVIDTLNESEFDGLLGFSQGACLVALIASISNNSKNHDLQLKRKIKFLIIACGFKSRDPEHEFFYTSKIDIPSLHLFGKGDDLVSEERSRSLLQSFVNPIEFHFDGNHVFPTKAEARAVIKDFLEKHK